MQNLSYEQIIAIFGMSIWFIYPIGMLISVIKQDQESLPAPKAKLASDKKDIFWGHKNMIYYDETEEYNNQNDNITDDDFDHQHVGIGSTHSHHIH